MVPRVAVYPTIELTLGADFYDEIVVTDPDTDLPVDLTGYSFKWQFRIGKDPTSTLLADLGVTADTELTITAADGSIYGRIEGSVTADFPSEVWHDLRADDPDGIRSFFWRGKVTMAKGVTEV